MKEQRLYFTLERLYDAIETGKLNLDDVVTRIRELRSRQDQLQARRMEIEGQMSDRKVELADLESITDCVEDLRELIAAIRAVREGESVLHPAIARKVLSRFAPASNKPGGQEPSGMPSERETEVLRLMAKGASNKQIADALHLSIRTVQASTF